MKTVQIDQDVYNFVMSKAAQAGELPSLILRRELQVPPPLETIEVDDDTYEYLLSRSAILGESASDILRRELHMSEAPPHDPADAIVFHIPAGTGSQPWNTRDAIVVATVGDVLRVVNDDAISHRLHTDGAPFPHPNSDILPGNAADFVLQSPFDPVAGEALYDHAAGTGAKFWISVGQPL